MSSDSGAGDQVHLRRIQRAELSACDQAATFLQSGFWGAFKAAFGWEALAFSIEWGTGNREQGTGATIGSIHPAPSPQPPAGAVTPLLALRRRLAAGFSLAYIPWGPQFPAAFPADDNARAAALTELALALKERLPADTAFIRFDPPWRGEGVDASPPRLPPPFVRATADIQAPDTVLVDLTPPMESVMERMKPKWRYNARLALKKGVTARQATLAETDVFYELLKETAKRDGIAIHSVEYYKTLLASGRQNGVDVRLYLAEHEGDTLAGIVTLFRGREAVYLYGASSDHKRNLMAAYALQVNAIQDAMAAGCREYDLFGIPPSDDPSHPMAGLYRFKTGFGGKIIHRPGSWDFPCRPLVYRLFRAAEASRKKARDLKKKIPDFRK